MASVHIHATLATQPCDAGAHLHIQLRPGLRQASFRPPLFALLFAFLFEHTMIVTILGALSSLG